jgi:hypothetical protein
MITKEMLDQLIASNDTMALVFRDPKTPGQFGAAVEVRYMNTAGGMQYAVRQISSRGAGGGMYTTNAQECIDWAMGLVEHFTRPTPFRQKMVELGYSSNNSYVWVLEERTEWFSPGMALFQDRGNRTITLK